MLYVIHIHAHISIHIFAICASHTCTYALAGSLMGRWGERMGGGGRGTQPRIPEWRLLSDLLHRRLEQRDASVPLSECAFHTVYNISRTTPLCLQSLSRCHNRARSCLARPSAALLCTAMCSRTKSDIAIGQFLVLPLHRKATIRKYIL